MKRYVCFLLFLCVSVSTFGQKATLGIMDLAAREGVSAKEALIVTEFIFTAAYQYGAVKYRIIARSQRDELLAEYKFALSGLCDDTSCAVEIGKYLTAEYMIVGSFTKFGNKYYITLQLANVTTTSVEGSSRMGRLTTTGL